MKECKSRVEGGNCKSCRNVASFLYQGTVKRVKEANRSTGKLEFDEGLRSVLKEDAERMYFLGYEPKDLKELNQARAA